jgi:uncharacterized protein YlaI
VQCEKCGAPVSYDESGLNQKLRGKDVTQFLCIDCLAKKYDVPKERLLALIEDYRRTGCVLFVQKKSL